MAGGHSRKAVTKLANRTGSATQIQRYFQKIGLKRKADLSGTTAIGDKGVHKIDGLVDFSLEASSGFANPTLDDILDAALSMSKAAEHNPFGTDSGRVKYSGNTIVNQYDLEGSHDGPVTCSFSSVGNGPLTRGSN